MRKFFRDAITRFEDKENIIVALDSPGGDALAVGIGNIIWRAGMATLVPADKTCASTCALIWLAAPPGHRYIGRGGIYRFPRCLRRIYGATWSADERALGCLSRTP